MKQKLIELQDEIYKSNIMIREFNTFLSLIDGFSSQQGENKKEIVELNGTLNQLSLIYIHDILHLTTMNAYSYTHQDSSYSGH